jgi:ABC-type phosphate transport system substrate-binding protein
MNRRSALSAALVVGTSGYFRFAQAAGPLVVVVNAKSGQSTFSESELAAIFTTRKRNFDGGERIIPLNLPPRNEGRVTFDQQVLGMGPDEVARYWIDRKVRGGNSPPRHVPSAALLARLVEKLPGAIGYVPESLAGGLTIVARI